MYVEKLAQCLADNKWSNKISDDDDDDRDGGEGDD